MGRLVISATERAAPFAHYSPHSDFAVRPAPFIPWSAHRDERGEWVVERHGAWSCTVRLTGVSSSTDERLEEHARVVADALNRVYSGR